MCKSVTIALCAISLSLCAIPAFCQNGRITELSGTVELKLAGAADWSQAKMGDEIEPNTVISTGFKSMAAISVGSATILVRPLTRLSLTEIAKIQDAETINVNLAAGRVRVNVKPPSGTKADFTVTGPTATASVRGTSEVSAVTRKTVDHLLIRKADNEPGGNDRRRRDTRTVPEAVGDREAIRYLEKQDEDREYNRESTLLCLSRLLGAITGIQYAL